MDHRARSPAQQRHLQRREQQLGAQMPSHGPAHHSPAPGIEHHGQVEKAARRGNVGDVSHPELIGARGRKPALDQARSRPLELFSARRHDEALATGAAQALLAHPTYAELGPVLAHEPEDLGGIVSVSRANQAAALAEISRSSRRTRTSRRSRRSSFRSSLGKPDTGEIAPPCQRRSRTAHLWRAKIAHVAKAHTPETAPPASGPARPAPPAAGDTPSHTAASVSASSTPSSLLEKCPGSPGDFGGGPIPGQEPVPSSGQVSPKMRACWWLATLEPGSRPSQVEPALSTEAALCLLDTIGTSLSAL